MSQKSEQPEALVITIHPDNSILDVRAHDDSEIHKRTGKISDGDIDGERYDFVTCVAHMRFEVDREVLASCRWSEGDCGCRTLRQIQLATEIRMLIDGGLLEAGEDHKHGTVRACGSIVVLGGEDEDGEHRILIDPHGNYFDVWW